MKPKVKWIRATKKAKAKKVARVKVKTVTLHRPSFVDYLLSALVYAMAANMFSGPPPKKTSKKSKKRPDYLKVVK